MPRCAAITARGIRCSRAAKPKSKYCAQHGAGTAPGKLVVRVLDEDEPLRCPKKYAEDRWLADNAHCTDMYLDEGIEMGEESGLWVVSPLPGVEVWKGSRKPIGKLTSRISWFGQHENASMYAEDQKGYMHRAVFKKQPKLVLLNNSANVYRLMEKLSPSEAKILKRITGVGLTSLPKEPYVAYPCAYKGKPRDTFARYSVTDIDAEALRAICKKWKPYGVDGWYQQAVAPCYPGKKSQLFMSEMALCDPAKFLEITDVYKV